jgi:hypothetical protein
MSRWLNQVNNLLEKLDGQVETVAASASTIAPSASTDPSHKTNSTKAAAVAATTAAVSVSRAAAVFGSNLVQQAAASSRQAVKVAVAATTNIRTESDDDFDDDDYNDDDDDDELDGEGEAYDTYTEDDNDEDALTEDDEYYSTEQANETGYHNDATTLDINVANIEQPTHVERNDVTNDAVITQPSEDENNGIMDVDKVEEQVTLQETKGPTKPTDTLDSQSNTGQKWEHDQTAILSEDLSPSVATNLPQQQLQQQQQDQAYQKQIEHIQVQHASEISKLLQQNEAAIQQVIRQNEIERKQYQQQSENDRKQLQQQSERYKLEIQNLQTELKAVNKELQSAATIVEQERAASKLERDEILDEQEEEILQIKEEYEEKIKKLHVDIKELKEQYEGRLLESREQHIQLGDTLEEQLQDMTEREELARKNILKLQTDNESLQQQVQQLKSEYNVIEQQFLTVTERLTVAEAAVIAAEVRYDEANEQYRKQSQQRLARESMLEQRIAQLSQTSAVTNAQLSEVMSDDERQKNATMIAELRGQCQVITEELESTKTDLVTIKQQYLVLEQEYHNIVQERQRDMDLTKQLQEDYDARIHKLNQQLEAQQHRTTLVSDTSNLSNDTSEQRVQQLTIDLNQSKERVVSLSDQLIRQQNIVETQKTEILALKGRLQVALNRAENAENQLQQKSSSMVEIELGRTSENDSLLPKRRIKGINRPYNLLPNKSIRAAIGLQQSLPQQPQRTRNTQRRFSNNSMDLQQQIGSTVDAIDQWMIESGHILYFEPMARLGFAIYFCMIHLFCFTLIAFHTIEAEHGDLGQLTDRSRLGVGIQQRNA